MPSFAKPKMNEVFDDIHDDNDVEKRPQIAANASSISGLRNNSIDHPKQPLFEASFHKETSEVKIEQNESSENAVAPDALNPDADKDYDDQADVYEHSEEDEGIVVDLKDKNSGEVVVVTEASSFNEAVELAMTMKTLVSGI